MRLLATTFPKSGTNLLIQLLGTPQHIPVSHDTLHRGIAVHTNSEKRAMNKEVDHLATSRHIAKFDGTAVGHIPWSETIWDATRTKRTALIFLHRDPRDVVVSHLHHVQRHREASMNYVFPDGTTLIERSDPLLDLIELSPARWSMFLPWLSRADLVLTFAMIREHSRHASDLIRNALERQATTVLAAQDSDSMVKRVMPSLSPTFRKGIRGEWKKHFKDHHIAAYWELMTDTHQALGYGNGMA